MVFVFEPDMGMHTEEINIVQNISKSGMAHAQSIYNSTDDLSDSQTYFSPAELLMIGEFYKDIVPGVNTFLEGNWYTTEFDSH